MKKITIILGVILLFTSCRSKMIDIATTEIIIANKALSIATTDYKKINLLVPPDNEAVLHFRDGGFYDTEKNIYRNKFHYEKNKVQYWDKNSILDDTNSRKKINFISNLDKVPKIGFNDTINAKTYHAISNVMFSDEGQYAIFNITSFSNLPIAQYYEGQMYVFKKKDDEWVFQFTFMTAIS